jgi:NAD(P)-dependent dehydrogenase (short-subunit alcohol dehydrogenase family)
MGTERYVDFFPPEAGPANRMNFLRYQVSKLIQHLLVTELADRLSKSTKDGARRIVISLVNPGWVLTDIMRSSSTTFQTFNKVVGKIVARTPEEGGRILVNAAEGGVETHGKYLDDCKPGK